eukprot:TRINITY_DN4819_c0_g1_i2.p1 TRINITY_DN4819_c0_g1~~TRINITY_DN4819_c0_g1_i2.p1  ORF type:complete len:333 (-),score=94.26 TRINITY_DN4819_c0_g1_i2:519-1451(-)
MRTLDDIEEEDVEIFKKNRVSGKVLVKLGKDDLEKMGFPVGVQVLITEAVDELKGGSAPKTQAPSGGNASTSAAPAKKGFDSVELSAPFKRLHLCEPVNDQNYDIITGIVECNDPSYKFCLQFDANNNKEITIFQKTGQNLRKSGSLPAPKGDGETEYQFRDLKLYNDGTACASVYNNGYSFCYLSITEKKIISCDKWYPHNSGRIHKAILIGNGKVLARSWDARRGGSCEGLEIRDIESAKATAWVDTGYESMSSVSNVPNPNLINSHLDSNIFWFSDENAVNMYDIRQGLKSSVSSVNCKRGYPRVSA